MTITTGTSTSTTRGSTPISSAAPMSISGTCRCCITRYATTKGRKFLLAKDVVPNIEDHDQYNDCIRVADWPAMKAYIEANR